MPATSREPWGTGSSASTIEPSLGADRASLGVPLGAGGGVRTAPVMPISARGLMAGGASPKPGKAPKIPAGKPPMVTCPHCGGHLKLPGRG